MLKLGILDFDTSHAVEFTRRLNQVGTDKEQFVEGAKIVIGCPGESVLSPERIAGFTEQMKKYGVPLVDKPEEMIGKVDGMLIEAVDCGIHGVEMLYTVMGPGCQRVTSTHEKGVDVVTGHWRDGRVATLRGIRSGAAPYGVVGFAEKGVQTVAVGTKFIYRELLKQIVE